MGLYTKALHHVSNKDFKKTHQRRCDEQKVLCKIEKKQKLQERKELNYIEKLSSPFKSDWRTELFVEEEYVEEVSEIKVNVKVSEKLKSNWRKELTEGMTTVGGEIQLAPTSEPLDILDAGDPLTFNNINGGPDLGNFDGGVSGDGLSGTRIVSSGSGSNDTDGFNLGKDYLAFNLQAYDDGDEAGLQNFRFAVLTPMDTTRATTLEITAIVGNNSNGGESPEIGEDITLGYTIGPNSYADAFDDNFNKVVVVPYNGSGNLKTYSVTIPNNEFNNLRKENVSFILVSRQNTSSVLTSDNYGITEIKLKRTTPISVLAPLDTPEAVSFMRVGTGPNVETPEQRYRRIAQQLLASKKYTTTTFGSNFPGSNFSGISGVSASPIGKQASYDTWSQASKKNAQQSASTFTYTYDVVTNSGVQKATYTGTLKSTPTSSPAPSPTTQTTTYRGGLTTAGKVTGLTAISKSSVPSTPPKTQPTPKLLTPQQLSNLDKQIADLQRQSEKNKQDARNNQWRAVGELGMGALQAAAILSPIPGDEAVVAAALAAKTGPKAAGAFAKANPGKYNPFLSQQSNKYFNLPRK